VAKQQGIKIGKALSQKEMEVLIEELFNCETPNATPNGSPTYLEFTTESLERIFGK
jgi:DNA mismatch repair protein MutL